MHVTDFPISTTISGVIPDLKKGGLRELHGHPNADEWQYYIKGRAQVGIFGAHGRSKEISLSTWLSNNSAQIIADNFGLSLDEVAHRPKTKLAIMGAPPVSPELSA